MRRGDIADLAAFVTIADHLNFRVAASRLGVTPSALSHTLRGLRQHPRRLENAVHAQG